MTETSMSPEALPVEADDVAAESVRTDTADESPSPMASSADRKVRYCPTCHARYARAASECVTCSVALVDNQPRDIALFRPELDVPFVVAFVLYVFGHDKLNGEAQSFGLIFLIVGFATLVTFRAISYVEWLGRR